MKKLISILLVAMLIIGMFPATTLTALAATQTYTKVTTAPADWSGTYLIVCEKSNVAFNGALTASNIDAAGNSIPVTISNNTISANSDAQFIIESVTGGYTIKSSGGAYLGRTANSNGMDESATTKHVNTIALSSDGTVTIKTSEKTPTLQYYNNGTNSRFRYYATNQQAICLYKLDDGGSEPEKPECTHENSELQNDKEATCTTPGYTGDLVCTNPECGEIVKKGETIPAGHKYENGICSNCGTEEPAGYQLVTDLSTLTLTDKIVITGTHSNGKIYAMSNDKGTSAAPSAVQVTVDGDMMTSEATDNILWNVEYSNGSLTFYPAGDNTKWLYCTSTNNGVRVGTNTAKAFTIDTNSGYLKHTGTSRYLGVYSSTPDWRCYTSPDGTNIKGQTFAFYKLGSSTDPDLPECTTHENAYELPETAVEATCTTAGKKADLYCPDCKKTIEIGEEISVLDHTYANGVCSGCGLYEHQAELMTTMPGNGDVIIIYHPTSGNALGLSAKGDDLSGITTAPVESKLPYYTSVAQLTVGLTDGEYTFANAEGKYLTAEKQNTLAFADLTDNGKWTLTQSEDKVFFENAAGLALEYYPTAAAFTSYTGGTGDYYQMNLYLVEKGAEACQHPNAYEMEDGYAAKCGVPGMTNSVYCPDCKITVTPQKEIPALDHVYVDGICINDGCGAEQVIANYVKVTSLDEITDGQYVIVAEVDGIYYALDTETSGKPAPVVVEISNNTVTTADAPVWTVAAVNGNITLQTGDSYLGYSSNTNFAAVDAYEWIVAAAGNSTFNFTASTTVDAESTVRGILYRSDTEVFGAYAVSNNSQEAYHWDLQLYKYVQPVVAADGTGYNSVEKALADGKNDLKLYADVDSITYDGDLYLDLNGYSVGSVVLAGDLHAFDSKATTSAASGAKIAETNVNYIEKDFTADGKRYIALQEGECGYSFHVLEMQLTAITLRTTAAGIYYKATVVCDEELAAAADTYGIALSTRNMPGANFATEKDENGDVNGWTAVKNDGENALTSGKAFTSGSVFGIFKEGLANNAARGEIKIYANAYIKVGNTVIMADKTVNDEATDEGFNGIAWSMKNVMQKLESVFTSDSLTDTQKENIAEFYRDWSDEMGTWGLTNIAQAAAALPAA